MATGGSYWALPTNIMCSVLGDAIADGIDRKEIDAIIKELRDNFLITTETDKNGQEAVALMNPALGDIAFDLCTPSQIDSICRALLQHMETMRYHDYRIPFVMARFLHRLGKDDDAMVRLWQHGYKMLRAKRRDTHMVDDEYYPILEAIDEEILSFGFKTKELLGDDFSYPAFNEEGFSGTNLIYVKYYIAPIAFGPMGHTLSVLTRNIFHEMKCPDSQKHVLESSFSTARERYFKEAEAVERLLREYGLGASEKDLKDEFNIIWDISIPAGRSAEVQHKAEEQHEAEEQRKAEVQHKAKRVHEELIRLYVESRRVRLLRMIRKIGTDSSAPWPVLNAEHSLRHAFDAMRLGRFQSDSAHDALMILATNHWKPKKVPEYLPVTYYQTTARLLDKVLRQLNEAELKIFRHRQGPEDLAAFLITTPLLYQWDL